VLHQNAKLGQDRMTLAIIDLLTVTNASKDVNLCFILSWLVPA